MLRPDLPHRFGDLAPPQPVDLDESEDLNVFLCGPLTLLDDGVEVIEPLLAAVIDVPEVFGIGFEE